MSYLRLEEKEWDKGYPPYYVVSHPKRYRHQIEEIGWTYSNYQSKIISYVIHDRAVEYQIFEEALLVTNDIMLRDVRGRGLYK